MNEEDLYSNPSPEEPYIFSTKADVFGGEDDPVKFLYGGTSDLAWGGINPENFARFPQAAYDSGAVEPGKAYRVINPEAQKSEIVIARDASPDAKVGLSLAPHTYLELGGSKDGKYLIDFRPVKGYPVAQYNSPQVSSARPDVEGATSILPEDKNDATLAPDTQNTSLASLSTASNDLGSPTEPRGAQYAQNADTNEPSPAPARIDPSNPQLLEEKDGIKTYDTGVMVLQDNSAIGPPMKDKGGKIIGNYIYEPDGKPHFIQAGAQKDPIIHTVQGRPMIWDAGKQSLVPAPMEGGASELPDPPDNITGEEAIRGLSNLDQIATKEFALYGRQPPTSGRPNPKYDRLEPYIMAYRPDYEGMIGYKKAYTTSNEYASTRASVAGGQINSANTAMRHLNNLIESTSKLDNAKIKKYNSFSNFLENESGDPSVVAFNRDRDTLVGEFQKMITGGVPHAEDVKRGVDNLNSSNSPQQIRAAVKQMAQLMSDKLTDYDDHYEKIFKKPYDGLVHKGIPEIAKKLGVRDFAGRADAAPSDKKPYQVIQNDVTYTLQPDGSYK